MPLPTGGRQRGAAVAATRAPSATPYAEKPSETHLREQGHSLRAIAGAVG